MRKWSAASFERLSTCDPRLTRVMSHVLNNVADVSIVSGHRSPEEQDKLYADGKSKLKGGQSKHNYYPSRAVDFAPYPYPDSNLQLHIALAYIAGAAVEYGRSIGVKLRWGGDWDQDCCRWSSCHAAVSSNR